MTQQDASPALRDFIKKKENCARYDKLKQLYFAYPDGGGISTIGWGHRLTHADIAAGVFSYGLSAHSCDLLFEQDLRPVVNFVNSLNLIGLTQGQFGALVDFGWNSGVGNLHRVVAETAPTYAALPDKLRWYVHDHAGNIEPGLVNRREAEISWWDGASIIS